MFSRFHVYSLKISHIELYCIEKNVSGVGLLTTFALYAKVTKWRLVASTCGLEGIRVQIRYIFLLFYFRNRKTTEQRKSKFDCNAPVLYFVCLHLGGGLSPCFNDRDRSRPLAAPWAQFVVDNLGLLRFYLINLETGCSCRDLVLSDFPVVLVGSGAAREVTRSSMSDWE